MKTKMNFEAKNPASGRRLLKSSSQDRALV